MEHRWFALSVGALLLAACSGPPQVRETVYRRRPADSASSRTTAPKSARSSTRTATLASNVTQSSKTAATKDAEERPTSASNEAVTDDIAKDAEETFGPLVRRRGVVKAVTAEEEDKAISATGIEGSMSEYDVKATLEGHAAEFDRCHDEVGGGSGHVTFRIRILPSGDVSEVGVRKSSVRNQKLVGCYSDVITASHFNSPHGGYANVTWSTKVGRSKKRPDAMFERKVRWDAPSASEGGSSPERSEKRRHKSRRRRDS